VTARHADPTQAELAAQSALEAQLVLQLVPEQTKLFVQFLGLGKAQVPAAHVPGPMTWGPEQLEPPHDPVGNEHTFSWQVPLHAAMVPMQSELVQQPPVGMQAPLAAHSLKPVEEHEQTPAPVHVKFAPHGAGAGTTQEPLAHVPAPMRLPFMQMGLLQPPVAG
jgi:hypothetical protein